jgi:23S rRNA pseudouridine1911/1915/1917 synthase
MLQDSLTFTIDQASVDSRLDAYLASQISHWSRARLQRLIDNEDVLVNGKSAKSSYRLRAGDEIEVELISAPI